MRAQHRSPEETAEGHALCNAEVSIAHHRGTFWLTNEQIKEPIQRLAAARQPGNLPETAFAVLRRGERWRRTAQSEASI